MGPSEGGQGRQDAPDGVPVSGRNAYPAGANGFFADVDTHTAPCSNPTLSWVSTKLTLEDYTRPGLGRETSVPTLHGTMAAPQPAQDAMSPLKPSSTESLPAL